MNEGSRKAIIAAFCANLGIAISKFVGFLITGSAGLAAESVHSFADTGNQALLFLGGKRADKKLDADHPFGHQRERYFWAFVVALVLFSMGGLFALYEGVHKFRAPHETDSFGIAVGILVVALILEGFSLRTAMKETSHVKPPDMSYWQFIRTAKQPELPTVLLEDVAAEVGLIFALVGVITAHFTHDPRWDAVGSIAIGILLVAVAFILAIEMKGLLLGETASPETQNKLLTAIRAQPHVRRVVYMHTEHMGPDTLLVACKVIFDPQLPAIDVSRSIDAAEEAMRLAVPAATFIFIEPDIAIPFR